MLRRAFTTVEMVVVMVIGAMILAMLASLAAGEQRLNRQLGAAQSREDQLQQTEMLLPAELHSLAPALGDIVTGGARDTSLEFRATIAAGVVCDTQTRAIVLAPSSVGPSLSSELSSPSAGDTAWIAVMSSSGEGWLPLAISGTATDHGGCTIGVADVVGGATGRRTVLRLSTALPLPAPGTPVRVTRLRRYSLYKSSDAKWYLGVRDWNASSGKFDAIQPVSGPFRSAAQSGLVFRYADSLGNAVGIGATNTPIIALISVAVRSDSGGPSLGRAILVGAAAGHRAIALRNH